MELNEIKVEPSHLKRSVLLVDASKRDLKGKYVLKYIQWGERENFDQNVTIKNRTESGKLWYDVKTERRSPVLWSKSHQYRHMAFLNPDYLISNCRMYDLFPLKDLSADLLCAVLNSTVVALTKSLFGRYVGREGSLDTEVSDTKIMLVPNPAVATPVVAKRLRTALSAMSKRETLPLVDVDAIDEEWSGELAMADRQELDDAVLELLGVAGASERKQLRDELYREMTRLYREIRATEKKMQRFRTASARRGRPTPQSLAEEIWESFNEKPQAKPLATFVSAKAKTETVTLPTGKAKAVFTDMFNPNSLQMGQTFIALGSPERVKFALTLVESGLSGAVAVPVEPRLCAKALSEYEEHLATLDEIFTNAAAGFTADEQLQTRVVKELWKRAGRLG